jgi:hypothetical protein
MGAPLRKFVERRAPGSPRAQAIDKAQLINVNLIMSHNRLLPFDINQAHPS